MGSEELPVFGAPAEPSWRTKVANALYEYAKWQPDACNYFLDQVEAEHAHALAEKIRRGGVRYDAREFNAARAIGPVHTLEFVQSAVADFVDPEVSQ